MWWKKTCDHDFAPYRYRVVEYIPTEKHTPYNREGAKILSHVFCTVCGEVREVVNDGNKIRYKPLPQKT